MRSVAYAIRLPANQVLERAIEDLLTRPRGRPSHAPLVRYRSFHYQAASWDRSRRVIAKVEHHLGELFPRVGFIVTTLTGTNRAVVHFYNGSYVDIDGLFREQAAELDPKRREAILHRIQQLVHDKAMFAPILASAALTGVGPRVEEAGLGLIAGYSFSAPYEDVKLKGK